MPAKQREAFLALVDHSMRMDAAGVGIEADDKRTRADTDDYTGEIFSALLHGVGKRRETDFWPGWALWAGPYAQKCYVQESLSLGQFASKVIGTALAVLLVLYGYGAWKGSFAEMRRPPLAGAAWLLFSVVGIVGALRRWFRFRGTDWPPTPSEARAWSKARRPRYGDRW